jgi:hypothetical protein
MRTTRYEVCYTPKGTPISRRMANREYEDGFTTGLWSKKEAFRIANKLAKEGHYDIMIDQYGFADELDERSNWQEYDWDIKHWWSVGLNYDHLPITRE